VCCAERGRVGVGEEEGAVVFYAGLCAFILVTCFMMGSGEGGDVLRGARARFLC
jgi:hypothetical protein